MGSGLASGFYVPPPPYLFPLSPFHQPQRGHRPLLRFHRPRLPPQPWTRPPLQCRHLYQLLPPQKVGGHLLEPLTRPHVCAGNTLKLVPHSAGGHSMSGHVSCTIFLRLGVMLTWI